jgi:hypothetical protein
MTVGDFTDASAAGRVRAGGNSDHRLPPCDIDKKPQGKDRASDQTPIWREPPCKAYRPAPGDWGRVAVVRGVR